MHSELFQIGPFTLRMYGLCMALGFLMAWRAMVYLRKRTGQPYEDVTTLLTWIMITSIIGARAAYVIEHWSAEFAHDPVAIFRVDQGGLMFYGGLISAFLLCVVYTYYYKLNLFDVGDVTAAVLPLGQFFGRLGCFMHGCCYGHRTEAWYGISFPKGSPAWQEQLSSGLITHQAAEALPVIPTQLIESLATLLLFIALSRAYLKRYNERGFVSGCYLMGYATLRFFIEFLRGDPRALVGPLSIGQTISISIFLGGVACIAWSRTKGKTKETV
jgi:phosphatidylglycerol:prolipoprotein diacylglycerol transferase